MTETQQKDSILRAGAERRALKLVQANGITKPPVDVEKLAASLKIPVRYQPYQFLKDDPAAKDVAGCLVIEAHQTVIGINSTHSLYRQRFTIAYILGLVVLHKYDFGPVHLVHDHCLPLKQTAKLVEANIFAGSLLMPKRMLKKSLDVASPLDVQDDSDRIASLAETYQVTFQQMVMRLIALELLPRI